MKTVKLPEWVHKGLKTWAAHTGISMEELAANAILSDLKKSGAKFINPKPIKK